MIAISRSLILPIGFILMLPIFFGTRGIFMALPAAELFAFVLALYFLKKLTSKRIIEREL